AHVDGDVATHVGRANQAQAVADAASVAGGGVEVATDGGVLDGVVGGNVFCPAAQREVAANGGADDEPKIGTGQGDVSANGARGCVDVDIHFVASNTGVD